MKKVALIALVFLVVGIIGSVMYGDSVFGIGNKEKIDEQRQVNGAEINRIKMDVDVGDIFVNKSDSDEINVTFQGEYRQTKGNEVRFDVEQSGDELVITLDTQRDGFNFSVASLFNFNDFSNMELTVELPGKQYERILANIDVGDLTIGNINTRELVATSDVGEIVLNSMLVETTSIESNVGDVEVNNGVGAYDIESDTGEIELNILELTDNVEVATDVGDVEITLIEQTDNLILDLQTDVGDIDVENFSGVSNSSNREYYMELGEGGPKIQAATDVGDITVSQ